MTATLKVLKGTRTLDPAKAEDALILAQIADLKAANVKAAAIEAEAKRLKAAILKAQTEFGVEQFLDQTGEALSTVTTVERTGLDKAILARLAPRAMERAATLSEHYRLTLGRIKAKA